MESANETLPDHKEKTAQSPHHEKGAMATRWTPILGLLALGLLYMFLPDRLTVGPTWLPLAIEIVLIIPLCVVLLWQLPHHHITARIVSLILLGVVTLVLFGGVALLVVNLTDGAGNLRGSTLLRTAGVL